jgi:hypothetical protein
MKWLAFEKNFLNILKIIVCLLSYKMFIAENLDYLGLQKQKISIAVIQPSEKNTENITVEFFPYSLFFLSLSFSLSFSHFLFVSSPSYILHGNRSQGIAKKRGWERGGHSKMVTKNGLSAARNCSFILGLNLRGLLLDLEYWYCADPQSLIMGTASLYLCCLLCKMETFSLSLILWYLMQSTRDVNKTYSKISFTKHFLPGTQSNPIGLVP